MRETRQTEFTDSRLLSPTKRQMMVDTDRRALVIEPQPANIQGRDGAGPVLKVSRKSYPFVEKAFADSAYSGDRPQNAWPIDIEDRQEAA